MQWNAGRSPLSKIAWFSPAQRFQSCGKTTEPFFHLANRQSSIIYGIVQADSTIRRLNHRYNAKAERESPIDDVWDGIRYQVEGADLRQVHNKDNVENIQFDMMELPWILRSHHLWKD